MAAPKTILVVDDDNNIREVLRFALGKAGYTVVEAEDGASALTLFAKQAPDLLILDVMMPELDGTDVCRAIRKTSRVPIIFLSSRDEDMDRIIGLELGGDDYVTKPFSPRELVARVKAVLRRLEPLDLTPGAPKAELKPVQTHGRLRVDSNLFQVTWDGKEVTLTATEFALVAALLGYPGKVYSRQELMDRAIGDDVVVTDRTIDSHVRRIRRKFESVGADPIDTVHGVGYRLKAAP